MFTQEKEILEKVNNLSKKLPKFPDGRIDYTHSDISLILTIFIKFKEKILLLKRSNKVSTYKGKWNTVSGYIDESKPLKKKIIEEINEELGISKDNILSYNFGKPFRFIDIKINKTWIVHPLKVELKKDPIIRLDWEHVEFTWIKPKEIKKYDIVPNLDISLKRVLI